MLMSVDDDKRIVFIEAEGSNFLMIPNFDKKYYSAG